MELGLESRVLGLALVKRLEIGIVPGTIHDTPPFERLGQFSGQGGFTHPDGAFHNKKPKIHGSFFGRRQEVRAFPADRDSL